MVHVPDFASHESENERNSVRFALDVAWVQRHEVEIVHFIVLQFSCWSCSSLVRHKMSLHTQAPELFSLAPLFRDAALDYCRHMGLANEHILSHRATDQGTKIFSG